MKNLILLITLFAAPVFAQNQKAYVHTAVVNEKMFLQQLPALKETDFLSCVVQRKSLQNLDDIEISEDPFFVSKALNQIQSRPMTTEDLSLWLELAHRVNPKDLSAQQQAFLKTLNANTTAAAPHFSTTSEFVMQMLNRYSGILLIDGKFLNADAARRFLSSSNEVAVHQWTLLTNMSAPLSTFGTIEEFQNQLQNLKVYTDQDPTDFDQLGCSVHLMNSLESHIAEDQMTGNLTTGSGPSLKKDDSKMYWILPVVAGVIGAGAYEMRNKNISVHMPTMSFH